MDSNLSARSDRMDWTRRSLTERLELVERVFITYPRFEALLAEIRHCQRHAQIAADPPCLFISGLTGVGKTTVIKMHVRAHPRQLTESGTSVPVLVATIPVPATVKGLAARLLTELGDPNATRSTIWSLTDRFQQYLVDCQVEMIVLDELQHFVDRDRRQILQTVSDWLKVLIKDTGRPVVLLGLAGEAEKVLDANAQLARLFAARRTLAPFQWEPSAPETIAEFRRFLVMLDEALPLNTADCAAAGLAEPELAQQMFDATQGVVGDLMALVRRAGYLTLSRGEESLNRAMLAEAYSARLAPICPGRTNPFTNDGFIQTKVVSSASTPTRQAGRATNRRGPSAKAKRPRASEVLKS